MYTIFTMTASTPPPLGNRNVPLQHVLQQLSAITGRSLKHWPWPNTMDTLAKEAGMDHGGQLLAVACGWPRSEAHAIRARHIGPGLYALMMSHDPPVTVSEAARRIEINRPYLSNVLQGHSNLTGSSLVKLSDILGMTLEQAILSSLAGQAIPANTTGDTP